MSKGSIFSASEQSEANVQLNAKTNVADKRYSKSELTRTQERERRIAEIIKAYPRYPELRERLLKLGGDEVGIRPEPHLNEILSRGRPWSSTNVIYRFGRGSQCHANSAALWFVKSHRGFKIITGWALSDDGCWRQHSWGWHNNRVVETTCPREKYFGCMLSEEESCRFCTSNVLPDLSERLSPQSVRPYLGFAARGVSDKQLEDCIRDYANSVTAFACSELTQSYLAVAKIRSISQVSQPLATAVFIKWFLSPEHATGGE